MTQLFPQPAFDAATGLLMGGCSLALVFDAPALTAGLCRATATDAIAVDDEINVAGKVHHYDGGFITLRHGNRVIGTISGAGDFEFTFTATTTSPYLYFAVEPDVLPARHVITLSNWTRA
jgi:hypothetical protein